MAFRGIGILAAAAAVLVVASGAGAKSPPGPIPFQLFVTTDLPLGGIAWTGREWLYTSENEGRFETSDALGRTVAPLVKIDQGGEEVRCDVALGRDGFTAGAVYCHLPDDRIIRLERDGSFSALATLPHSVASDGSMAFDRGGLFGGGLVAATGGSASNGGAVYVVHGDGRVDSVGPYPGPGGSDNLTIAPARFGGVSRWALLAIDHDAPSGRVLAVSPQGVVRVLAERLEDGINPIAVISASPRTRAAGLPRAGLYVADTFRKSVYLAPAAGLREHVGQVVVGTEKTGHFWWIRPHGSGYQTRPLRTTLPPGDWNLESAVYVP
jgi:hypothetical protein